MRIHRVLAVAVLALAAAASMSTQAQTWPTRPVKLIVPFPPGGTGDLLGRLAAKEMESALGQAVVVENRVGAGGAIGSEAAAKSAPDGYTLVLSNVASHAIGPAVYAKMPYDALKDFTHIGLIAAVPSGIAVAANSPFPTLAALLDKARSAPGALRFGSNGNGTSSHVKLAITTDSRAARWPDVPSVRELGLAPLVASNWFGISGPAGIPGPIADRLNAALLAALNTPQLAERLRDLGAEPNRMSRADYTAMLAADIARWADVVRSANIKVD